MAFNLTVARTHTYYVIASGTDASSGPTTGPAVLVHNCAGGLTDEAFEAMTQRHGIKVAEGVDYNAARMHDGTATAFDHDIPGIGHDLDALGAYLAERQGMLTHVGKNGSRVGYDKARGVIIVENDRMIHAYRLPEESFKSGRYVEQ